MAFISRVMLGGCAERKEMPGLRGAHVSMLANLAGETCQDPQLRDASMQSSGLGIFEAYPRTTEMITKAMRDLDERERGSERQREALRHGDAFAKSTAGDVIIVQQDVDTMRPRAYLCTSVMMFVLSQAVTRSCQGKHVWICSPDCVATLLNIYEVTSVPEDVTVDEADDPDCCIYKATPLGAVTSTAINPLSGDLPTAAQFASVPLLHEQTDPKFDIWSRSVWYVARMVCLMWLSPIVVASALTPLLRPPPTVSMWAIPYRFHWTGVIADVRTSTIFVFDPLGTNDLWPGHFLARLLATRAPANTTWGRVTSYKVRKVTTPRQQDLFNCGLFVLAVFEQVLRKLQQLEDARVEGCWFTSTMFDADDIDRARGKLHGVLQASIDAPRLADGNEVVEVGDTSILSDPFAQ